MGPGAGNPLPVSEDGQGVALETPRARAEGLLYASAGAVRGALLVGDAGGGWDSPALGVYPRLCLELPPIGISALRVRFRHSTVLAKAVDDVRSGIAHLARLGVERIALVGHSFGGAVVRAVVALATQSHGAEPAARLAPRCALLLVREPRRFVVLAGARHVLDEAAARVDELVRAWIVDRLGPAS